MTNKSISKTTILSNLIVYGLTHGLIDGIANAVIFTMFFNQSININELNSLVILYNGLSFGTRPIFGLVSDYFKSPRIIALIGCFLSGVAVVIFSFSPATAIIFVGIGSSLFHVGGGSISLNLTPQKALAPGLFIAPGVVGVFLGALIGKSGLFDKFIAVAILVLLCVAIFLIKKPYMNYSTNFNNFNKKSYVKLTILLIFLAIASHSFISSILSFPWKSNFSLLLGLVAAITFGKALGGLFSDRFGWIKIAVCSVAISMPLLIFGYDYPLIAIIAMFLLNLFVPVAIVSISNLLPGLPGFASGLTGMAIIVGTLPVYAVISFNGNLAILIIAILFLLLSIYLGLLKYSKIFLKNDK